MVPPAVVPWGLFSYSCMLDWIGGRQLGVQLHIEHAHQCAAEQVHTLVGCIAEPQFLEGVLQVYLTYLQQF